MLATIEQLKAEAYEIENQRAALRLEMDRRFAELDAKLDEIRKKIRDEADRILDHMPLHGGRLGKQPLQVLQMLREGRPTNPQIAARLGVSVSTVKYHVKRLLNAYGASSRYEL